MDRQATEALATFCVDQRQVFSRSAWLDRGLADGRAVALAAKYLSMTSWYDRDEELSEVSAALHPTLDCGTGLFCEAKAIGFDWSYLSAKVRVGIALQRVRKAAVAVGIGAETPAIAGGV